MTMARRDLLLLSDGYLADLGLRPALHGQQGARGSGGGRGVRAGRRVAPSAHCRARLIVGNVLVGEEKRVCRDAREEPWTAQRVTGRWVARGRDSAPTRAVAVSPLVVTVASSPRSASVRGNATNRWPRPSRTSVANDPAPLDRLEVRTGHAGSEGAHRTLRYQRAALPAGQFSMTPTVSYPSRS